MDGVIRMFYNKAASQENAHAKALANYLFREIIEGAHEEYDISQDDMKQMCKKAVNRSALYVKICDDPRLKKAFLIEAICGLRWDEPEMTEDIKRELNLFLEVADELAE